MRPAHTTTEPDGSTSLQIEWLGFTVINSVMNGRTASSMLGTIGQAGPCILR